MKLTISLRGLTYVDRLFFGGHGSSAVRDEPAARTTSPQAINSVRHRESDPRKTLVISTWPQMDLARRMPQSGRLGGGDIPRMFCDKCRFREFAGDQHHWTPYETGSSLAALQAASHSLQIRDSSYGNTVVAPTIRQPLSYAASSFYIASVLCLCNYLRVTIGTLGVHINER
jgi:hypothetical protein